MSGVLSNNRVKETPENNIPKWLRRLQENSWEAEILISGGAIFSLLAAVDILLVNIRELRFINPFFGLNETMLSLIIAIKGITIGFFLHLLIRGVWISLTCLNFAYPQGINFGKLKITDRYLDHAQKFKLVDEIIRLDKVSGLLFFSSIVFLIIILGLILVGLGGIFFILAISKIIFSSNKTVFNTLFNSYLLLFILFLVDFIFAGLLRRRKNIGKFYFPIYKIFNFLSLAFIYRPWLQIIFSNVNKWKALIIILIFTIGTLFYVRVSIADSLYWRSFLDKREFKKAPNSIPRMNTFYDSNLDKNEIVIIASIPSEVINEDYLRIFIPYHIRYDESIRKRKATFLSDIIFLGFGEEDNIKTEWVGTLHPLTRQQGILTNISIQNLPNGFHFLYLRIDQELIKIPFWKY